MNWFTRLFNKGEEQCAIHSVMCSPFDFKPDENKYELYESKDIPLTIKGEMKIERKEEIQYDAKLGAMIGGVPDAMRSIGMHPWLWEYRIFIGGIPYFIYKSPDKMAMVVNRYKKTLKVELYKRVFR
tara:strand:+ start:376 stop:756 length:381 start_codon:yes stop_codon:yes gene_type:complete